MKDGAPARLTNGLDFRGEICGSKKLKLRNFIYFAQPTLDLNVAFCVESCPESTVNYLLILT